MKVLPMVVFLATATAAMSQQHALFVRQNAFRNGKSRVTRQAPPNTSADQMVQNILQWLQGVYAQNSRRIRQGTFREYLPPTNTQKPRPFEPNTGGTGASSEDNFIGYPPAGFSPNPPFTDNGGDNNEAYVPPKTPPSYPTQKPSGFTSSNEGYPPAGSTPQPPFTGYPPGTPSETPPTHPPIHPPATPPPTHPPTHPPPTHPPQTPPTQPPTHPPATYYPPATHPPTYPPATHPPETPATHPPTYPPATHPPQTPPTHPPTYPPATHPPTYPPPTHPPETPSTHPPQTPPTYPPQTPSTHPPQTPPTHPPTYTPPTQPPTQPPQTYPPSTHPPTHPPQTQPPLTHTPATGTHPPTYPTQPPTTYPAPGHIISTTEAPFTSEPQAPGELQLTDAPASQPDTNDQTISQTPPTTDSNEVKTDNEQSGTDEDGDLSHPPHIHAIDVECAKDMMTINIEFNRKFDGVIYSKGFYSNPDCRYVNENSGDTKYSFTVSLNNCGTEFINAFDTQGQSYLENVLVLQNEAGIQEVWDTIRSVRCLWEGNLNKALSVALSVGMLTQEIVTFSGDTAMAKLDIQLGRGPFAPPANGLVKIGDTMTLVVSVTGDPGFDIQVKDCRAKDSDGEHSVALTDESGCVVKPKLFGAFQKTRSTGNTGASIIAYAFFNAFKFPDVMDLMIECNVELCKTDCEMCPDPEQKLEPGRRRRRRDARNETSPAIGESVRMGKTLRVILPEDLSDGEEIVNVSQRQEVCLSTHGFVLSAAILISLLTCSTLFSAYQWHRNQRLLQKY